MGEYKSQEIRDIFGISHETVRRWAVEFQEYFSEGAKPDKPGQHRVYSDEDLRIFALISEMKQDNHSDGDIHASLKAGARGDFPSLLDNQTLALSSNIQLTIARKEIEDLKALAAAAQDEALTWRDKANKLDGQIEQLKAEIESLRASGRDELLMEIGKLKAMLEMAKGKDEG